MKSDFSNSQIGYKVWSPIYGYGEIIDRLWNERYIKKRIVVNFNGTNIEFYTDGRHNETDAAPTLFHKKPGCFKTKAKKTVKFDCWFSPENSEVFRKRSNGIIFSFNKSKNYYPAKATITYEVE